MRLGNINKPLLFVFKLAPWFTVSSKYEVKVMIQIATIKCHYYSFNHCKTSQVSTTIIISVTGE